MGSRGLFGLWSMLALFRGGTKPPDCRGMPFSLCFALLECFPGDESPQHGGCNRSSLALTLQAPPEHVEPSLTVYEEVGKVQAGQDLVSVGGVPGSPLPTWGASVWKCLSPWAASFNQPGAAFSCRTGTGRPMQ